MATIATLVRLAAQLEQIQRSIAPAVESAARIAADVERQTRPIFAGLAQLQKAAQQNAAWQQAVTFRVATSDLAALRDLRSRLHELDAVRDVIAATYTETLNCHDRVGRGWVQARVFPAWFLDPRGPSSKAIVRSLKRLLSRLITGLQNVILLKPHSFLSFVVIQRDWHVLHGAHPPREVELLRVPHSLSPWRAALLA